MIKKKRKKHDKIVLLAKSKLNNFLNNEFVLINNILKELYDIKEEIKKSNNKRKFKLYIKQCYPIV